MAAPVKRVTGLSLKSPRYLKPYPRRISTGVRRLSTTGYSRTKLRQPRPRMGAGARGATFDEDAALEARAQQDIIGSLEERIFYKALLTHKFKPDYDFTFQANEFGGRTELGGLIADFLFPVPRLVVNVQSYWHTEGAVGLGIDTVTRDETQQALLELMGYVVINLWPGVIRDQAALDWWIERNISHMWGTSSSPLAGGSSDATLVARGGTVDEFTELSLRVQKVEQIQNAVNAAERLNYLESTLYGMQGGPETRITSSMLATELTSTDFIAGVSGWQIKRDGTAEFQDIIARGAIYAESGIIEGVLTIGLNGGIFQGTGTFASPTNALKIYRSDGVGLIEMWGAGVKQVYFGTDGKLYAGNGSVRLDSDGVNILVQSDDTNKFQFVDGVYVPAYWKVNLSGSSYVNSELSLAQGYNTYPTRHAVGIIRVQSHTGMGAELVLTAIQGAAVHQASIDIRGDIPSMYFKLDSGFSALDITNTFLKMHLPLYFEDDVILSRGAANRLDLANGDSLNIVGGDLTVGGDVTIGNNQVIAGANGAFKGAGLQTLGDDDALSFTPPGEYGCVIIMARGASSLDVAGIYCFRTGASCANPYAMLTGGAAMAYGTGVLTTGTSNGVDAKFNINTHTDGKVYLKNRLGAGTRYISWVLLGIT